MTKVCTKCLQEKPLSAFSLHRQRGRKDRLRAQCKACRAAYSAQFYAQHTAESSASQRAYRQTHKTELSAYQQAYAQANRTRIAIRTALYRAANLEKTHQRDKAYREANRDALRISCRLRRLRNPTYMLLYRARHQKELAAQKKQWAQENPMRVRNIKRAYRQVRRARMRGVAHVVSIRHRAIAERDNWTCHICGQKVTEKTWSLDHLIPLSQGGQHVPENVALAHMVCNARRGIGKRIPAQLRLLP